MIKESFVTDDDTNALMIVWPDIYREKIFWHGLLRIYYEIINIIISNGYFITLVHHKGANIIHDLSEIDHKLSNINDKYDKFISLYEYNYDDIWIRDYGPKTTKSGLSKFNFNGYGNKYLHKNDSFFFNDFIKKYSINNKDFFGEIVIEGGNIINSTRDYIFNKNPIVMHNSLSWLEIKEKIKLLFDKSSTSSVSAKLKISSGNVFSSSTNCRRVAPTSLPLLSSVRLFIYLYHVLKMKKPT